MRKKESILKRHPIIPSIFFLLFAWILLYLITGFKDPDRRKKHQAPKNQREVNISAPDFSWKLKLSDENIRFQFLKPQKTFLYSNVKVQDSSDHLKVYKGSGPNSQIKIFLLQKRENEVQDVIVEKDGVYFYAKTP